MPLLILLGLAIPSGLALAYKSITTDTRATAQEITRSTGPQLITIAVAGLGIYAAIKLLDGKK